MRTLLVASLLFAPVLLHAQATSPAQPAQNLHSKLEAPRLPGTATESTTVPAPTLRISTGVIAPVLVHTVPVDKDSRWQMPAFGGARKVTVALMVNEKGIPEDLKIVSTSDVATTHNVLEAVRQFRFTPGTLNSVPTDVPVTLTVNVMPATN